MSGLQDLGKLIDDGIVKVQGMQKKYSAADKTEDIQKIIAGITNEMISHINTFVQDQMVTMKTIVGDMQQESKRVIDVVEVNKMYAETLRKKISADSITLVGTIKNQYDDKVNILMAEIKNNADRAMVAMSMEMANNIGEVRTALEQVHEIKNMLKQKSDELVAFFSTYREEMQMYYTDCKMKIKHEATIQNDKIIADAVEYIKKNFWHIVGQVLKNLLRKK